MSSDALQLTQSTKLPSNTMMNCSQNKEIRTFCSLNHASPVAGDGELLLAEEDRRVTASFGGHGDAELVVPGELAVALVAAVVKHEPQARRRFAAKRGD